MKRIFWILLMGLAFAACTQEEPTVAEIFSQKRITTNYPVTKVIFRDEVFARGEMHGGNNFSELGFYVSENLFEKPDDGTKILASRADSVYFSAWIEGLEANKYYYIRAYGKASGTTYYGGSIRFKTDTLYINDVILAEVETTNEPKSCKQQYVYGKISDAGGDPDGLVEYGAYYWPASDPTAKKQVSVMNDTVAVGGLFRVQIDGLLPDTDYCAQVYAKNNRQEQLYDEISFHTVVPYMPTVQTNAMNKVSCTYISASGTVTDPGLDPDLEVGFYYGSSPEDLSNKVVATSINELDFELFQTGLAKSTTYYIQAYVINSVGEAKGEILPFTTQDESKPVLAHYRYSYDEIKANVTETSINVRTSIVSDGGMDLTEAGVYWGNTPDDVTTKAIGTVSGTYNDVLTTSITGLSGGDVIYYKPFAVNALGEFILDMESLGTKIVARAYDYIGTSGKGDNPNKQIELSKDETHICEYYEMPGYLVKEYNPDDATEYEYYRYYFLDRNLGAFAIAESSVMEGSSNQIGNFYVFSYCAPGSVPSMGTQSVKNNGWIKDLPSQVTNWNQAGYNPCPKNYFVPTRNEWYSLIQSIPENKRNLTEVFKLFRFGRTGNRNNNGGNTANSNMCQLWTGDKDEITQAGSVFIARDSDTDASVNNPDAIRMAVLGPGYTNYSEVGGPNNINAKSGGAPVRAFRKMHVAKELIEPQE